jgi:hypothetical protein
MISNRIQTTKYETEEIRFLCEDVSLVRYDAVSTGKY